MLTLTGRVVGSKEHSPLSRLKAAIAYQPIITRSSSLYVACAVCQTLIRLMGAEQGKVQVGEFRAKICRKGWTIDPSIGPSSIRWEEREETETKPVFKTLYCCQSCLKGHPRVIPRSLPPADHHIYAQRDIIDDAHIAQGAGLFYDVVLRTTRQVKRIPEEKW